jgi:hypothetical protein
LSGTLTSRKCLFFSVCICTFLSRNNLIRYITKLSQFLKQQKISSHFFVFCSIQNI